MNTTLTSTTCSACAINLTVDANNGVVTAVVPSNGKRGSLHVPAHTVIGDVLFDASDDDGDLGMWDCPACGYADSYDFTQGV